jgi:hypothetical protein
VLKKIFGTMATGVVGFIFGLIAITVALATTFGIPTLIVLAVLHAGPFAKSTPTDASAAFCSTLNEMTNYATTHQNPKTIGDELTLLEYSSRKLSSASSIPSAIAGTVTATISTTNSLIVLLQDGENAGGLTSTQQTQYLGLDQVFNHEVSTMNNWYGTNC